MHNVKEQVSNGAPQTVRRAPVSRPLQVSSRPHGEASPAPSAATVLCSSPTSCIWEVEPRSQGFQIDNRVVERRDPRARGHWSAGGRAAGRCGMQERGEDQPGEDPPPTSTPPRARPELAWEVGSGQGQARGHGVM